MMLSALRRSALCKPASFSPTQLRLMSTKNLIINAVGSDRTGIVSDMTKHVTDAGGNVGESKAARLGKYFSLMMVVNIPEEHVSKLNAQLETMHDLNATVFETAEDDVVISTVNSAIAYSGSFTLEGADNPGIVHKVTSILAKNGLSIDKMETSDSLAPGGSTVLFEMHGIAHAYEPLAAGFDLESIKQELLDLGDAMNCDISMDDL
ncbi:unnamed protein product [Cylindrotheca closterium]|uniref:ACT domain-containing protein n=1 Tax=Cylindrotheca closterium TaxID=2856 RepID=A0AAD2CF68_9STRA|nr:unnamed protein product [Cylindrotheca closterium]